MDAGEVRSELESLGSEGFVHRYGRFFLVITEAESLEDFAAFVNTATRSAYEVSRGSRIDRVDILPIVPKKRGISRVTVGRDANADVTLPSRNISKLHAYFTDAGGLLSLTDAGSRNGTWLNGAALHANRQVPVDVGDTVNFGSVSATIWGLDDLLAAVAPR